MTKVTRRVIRLRFSGAGGFGRAVFYVRRDTLSGIDPGNHKSERRGTDRLLSVLARRYRLILSCAGLVCVLAVVASLLQEKQYTAEASLLFRDPGYAQGVFGTDATTLAGTDPARQAATNVQLVGLRIVSERTAKVLGDLTTNEVVSKVTVSGNGLSDVVSVSATDSVPREAQRITNTFAQQFVAFRAEADRTKLLAAKHLADQEFDRLDSKDKAGPRGEQLSRGSERLGILASLQTGNAELVQPAVLPSSPSSPKPFRNGVLGLIAGLLLGIVLAFAFERFNRKIREPDEAEDSFGLPLLGTIPESKDIGHSNEGAGFSPLPFSEEESFRMTRASLRYFSVDRDIKTLLVTSSSAQAGKSTVAWNLARVAAKFSNVALLETDLRNPSMARSHGNLDGLGLAQVLTHQIRLEDAIQTVALESGSGNGSSGSVSLSVVTAGSVPPNPGELMESQAMTEVLLDLRNQFDFVVVDTAPIGVVSDSFPLMGQVDGVLVVARMDKTTRDSAKELREQLDRLDAPVLGVVANGVKTGFRGKYGYGYGYYGRMPDAEEDLQPAPTSD